MQRLWAPWRASYISSITDKPKVCVFCRIISQKRDKANYIFWRGPHCYAVLNLFPYSNGHCLVLPNRHIGDISKLTREEYHEMMDAVLMVKDLITKAMHPAGFNIGMNLGRMAGAGIPGHVHMHIVPRWKGDHNFMPVTGGAKVISQSLDVVYKTLIHAHTQRH